MNTKKLTAVFAGLSMLGISGLVAQEYQTLWSLDLNATNYGFDWSKDFITNSDNSALGTTDNSTLAEESKTKVSTAYVELNYTPMGGDFYLGKSAIKITGEYKLDISYFVEEGGAPWIGTCFNSTASEGNASNGTYFTWLQTWKSNSGLYFSKEGAGQKVAELNTAGVRTITNGDHVRFEYILDSTVVEDFLTVTLNVYDIDDNDKILISKTANIEVDETLPSKLAYFKFSVYNNNLAAVNGWIESLEVSGYTIPEPSTYALIFGALALGFVAIRRK